ncbi:MAG: matrixin family metalloprotease [Ornithinibacter sp.]
MNNTTRATISAAMLAGMVGLWPAQAQAATYWMAYPFFNDSIPVYDRTGRTATMTAVNRWEHTGDGYNLWRTYSASTAASSGVTIQWSSERAGTSIGGWAYQYYSSSGHTTRHCVIKINSYIKGIGRPSGHAFEAIVAHEFGHCLGLKHDYNSRTNIMRSGFNYYTPYYRPTTTDEARARAGMATN